MPSANAAPGRLDRVFGYQGNAMTLPVADVDAALPFYENVLGFRVVSRADAPMRSAVLGRDAVQIGLEENGGDSAQDGCAFHVTNLDALFAEYSGRTPAKPPSPIGTEQRGDHSWRVFFVVAPDGLCYWFGERQPA